MLEQESEALRRGDRHKAIRLSGGFHMAVAAICGEGALTQFLGGLISRSSLVIALYGRGPASACGHDEHVAFLDALAAGDGERAAAAMAEHLDHIVADLALAERAEEPVDLAEILTV
jgi:DNA-binding GntR family transcriptional regulator